MTPANDGARHVAQGPTLGLARQSEQDGENSPHADADEFDDGVGVVPIRAGQLLASFVVNVRNADGVALLDAWIDFDRDGTWSGARERIASRLPVINGDNVIRFDVPAAAESGTTYARFRLSSAGTVGVRGEASDGEVEDYEIVIEPPPAASGNFREAFVHYQFTGGHCFCSSWSARQRVHAIDASDFDGDGDVDVLTARRESWNTSAVSVILHENVGAGLFKYRKLIDIPSDADPGAYGRLFWATHLSSVDFDLDGDFDVLVSFNRTSRDGAGLVWYENTGSTTFVAHTVSSRGASSAFAVDIDGDGDIDVVNTDADPRTIEPHHTLLGDVYEHEQQMENEPQGRVWVHENDGRQGFGERLLAEGHADFVVASDLNRDGFVDVLTSSSRGDGVIWHISDGSGDFQSHTVSRSFSDIRSLAIADIDGDGDRDIAGVSTDENGVIWFENTGAEVFAERSAGPVGTPSYSLDTADHDGDGDIDLLSAVFTDAGTLWYENDGAGRFTIHTVDTHPTIRAIAADVDSDGDLDAISTHEIGLSSGPGFTGGTSSLHWYENVNPQRVIPLYPGEGDEIDPFGREFRWTAVDGAERYRIVVNNLQTREHGVVDVTVGASGYSLRPGLPFGRYRYWVQPVFPDSQTGPWSPPRTFEVVNAPWWRGYGPDDSSERPQLAWSRIAGAVEYDLWIDSRSTKERQFIRERNHATGKYRPPRDLPLGDYTAWVRAIDSAGYPSDWSQPHLFRVATRPTIAASDRTTLLSRPSFAWTPVEGATRYDLWVRNLRTGEDQVIRQRHVPQTRYVASRDLPDGEYRWWVRAVRDIGSDEIVGEWSEGARLSIAGAPVISSPVHLSSGNTPTFRWSPIEGADHYMLQVNQVNGRRRVIYETLWRGTEFVPKSTLPAGEYHVWVRAARANGKTGRWSAATEFTVTRQSAPPTLAPPVTAVFGRPLDWLADLK